MKATVALNNSRYSESNRLLERAERTIPLASQTFSKSRVQYPVGASPLFLERAKGARVWDIDGNEYVDMVSALLCVVLGHGDPDVDSAIRAQIENGISYSLPTPLEAELAERLVEIVPCAEMARFGKNGTDATSAAVRLARATTARDRIALCGYHGWQDWYIGATSRHLGVPEAVRALSHAVPYNDLDAVDRIFRAHPGEFAALILEPVSTTEPAAGYLDELKVLVHRHGALLIFDEIITGFRFALGGAQELFGVTPDLAVFGKAMGNGMPISAIVGRAELMRGFEEVFFSGTFGGEALSLAAAIAVIDKMRREPVIETLWRTGECLRAGVRAAIDRHDLGDTIGLHGMAPWSVLRFHDRPGASKEAIKTLYMVEMIRRGVLTIGSHNINYALDPDSDIPQVLDAYDETLRLIAGELETGRLEERLDVPLVQPVFSVRP